MEYLCHKWPQICSNCRKHFPVLSSFIWLITGFGTRLTRRVPLVEQELHTVPEHMSSPPVFSGVRVTRSLVLYVCFVDRCLSFFFWLLCCLSFFDLRILIILWYLQTLPNRGPSIDASYQVLVHLAKQLQRIRFLYLRSTGRGHTVLPLSVRPSVFLSVQDIFLSNYWWQKSDIWSQTSYRYAILWETFLDPSDSYFLFADLVGFYTHWTYMRGYHKWALALSSSC